MSLTNRAGWLPIYLSWNQRTQSYTCSIGMYAVDTYFRFNTYEIKACCVPYVQDVPVYSVEELETVLQACWNSPKVIDLICRVCSPESWLEHFWVNPG